MSINYFSIKTLKIMIYYLFTGVLLIILVVYSRQQIIVFATNYNAKVFVNLFTILSITNVIIAIFLLATYSRLRFKEGPKGPIGVRGVQGYQGKDGSCAMCKPTTPGLRPIRPYNKMDSIDPMHRSDMMEELFPIR
jgi:hypothetical protein